jgi:hypothetical protein
MSGKLLYTCAMVLAASSLLGGNASAQVAKVSDLVKVSDTIEAGPVGAPVGGVSAARCGNNIVVGFADAEASPSNSFDGYAVSSDGGKTFRDLGVLPVSSQVGDFGPDILGDATTFRAGPTNEFDSSGNSSLACGSANVFYYASIYLGDNPGPTCPGSPFCSAISVSTSTDGGVSWNLPVFAAVASEDNHSLLFPSIAVDPSNPQRVYVAYLYWNNFGPLDFIPGCEAVSTFNGIMVIKVASSADGGNTWTESSVENTCAITNFGFPELVAPRIAVSATGEVYVAYEFLIPGVVNEIHFARSLNQGQTFSTPLKVSGTAIANAQPKLAVDRTRSKHTGAIYLAWSGAPVGTYSDVLVAKSLDKGRSFSFPQSISADPPSGTGRFQVDPVLAVDHDGDVQACFYETPSNQPSSSSVYSYNCGLSHNRAATWHTRQVSGGVPPGYDSLTSDFLLRDDGFFTAFEVQNSSGQRHVVGEKSDEH